MVSFPPIMINTVVFDPRCFFTILILILCRHPLAFPVDAAVLVFLRSEREHHGKAVASHRHRKHLRGPCPAVPLLARGTLPRAEPVLLLLRPTFRSHLPQPGQSSAKPFDPCYHLAVSTCRSRSSIPKTMRRERASGFRGDSDRACSASATRGWLSPKFNSALTLLRSSGLPHCTEDEQFPSMSAVDIGCH